MESMFDSLKQGATDLARGMTGKETGIAQKVSVVFTSGQLGLTVSDHGGEGLVSAIVPGGEAERIGVLLNDRVVKVGTSETKTYKEAVAAIRNHPQRPMTLLLERREKGAETNYGPGVNFRLDEEMTKAERILELMIASPKSGPPIHVLRNARGLAFLRVTKLGFALSARLGTGLVVARTHNGGWSAPSAIGTIGMSFGIQIGAQIADFLIVLNTVQAVEAFSGGGQVTIGGQIGAVAGPVGASREAGVVAQQSAVAPIFTYSISKGVFVGVSLEGSAINERNSVNERHYSMPGIRAQQILNGQISPTPAAAKLLADLARLDLPASASTASYAPDALHTSNPDIPLATQVPPPPPPPSYDESNPFRPNA